MENKELGIDDWELIPHHDTFLGISLQSPKKGLHINPQMDYFVCPSEDSSPAEDPDMQCLQSLEKELREDQVFKDIGVVVPQPVKHVEPEVEEAKKMEFINELKKEEEEEVKGADFEVIHACEEEKKPKPCCGFGGGLGALCSIGVAAATILVFVLGGRQQQEKQQYQNQRLQFKIYADEKRMKQVVQQASRLNQAISVAVRGVPMTRAHISFGGYYEGI